MTERETLRVGVVGAGVMGERHARVLSEIGSSSLIGVYDPQFSRANDVATRYGASAFVSLDDLIENVDAVSIASATGSHCEVGLAVLEAGRHAFIEKPLAGSLYDARRILDCSSRLPRLTVMVGHIERFNPTIQILLRRLGGQRIISIETRRMSPFDGRSIDSDVIHDLMIHDIDLVLELLGDKVKTMDAAGFAVETSHIDRAMAQLTMEDGVQASLVASRVASAKVRAIEIYTTREHIHADLLGKRIVITPNDDDQPETSLQVPGDEPLRLELEHFVNSVLTGAKPIVDADAGYRAMVYAKAIGDLISRSSRVEMAQTLLAHAGD